jgi:hypothetical protein
LMNYSQYVTNGNADWVNVSIKGASISKQINSHDSVLFARENLIVQTDLLHRRCVPIRLACLFTRLKRDSMRAILPSERFIFVFLFA